MCGFKSSGLLYLIAAREIHCIMLEKASWNWNCSMTIHEDKSLGIAIAGVSCSLPWRRVRMERLSHATGQAVRLEHFRSHPTFTISIFLLGFAAFLVVYG